MVADEELEEAEKDLIGYCTVLANAVDCAKDKCASKALNQTGWSARDEFWAAYAYETAPYSWSIFKGLLVSGFEWDKVEAWVAKHSSRSLLRGPSDSEKELEKTVLVEWAKPFAQFCTKTVSGWNVKEVSYFVPMRDNKDYFGMLAVTSELGVGTAFLGLLKETKWDFQQTAADMLKGMEDHCGLLGFSVLSWYVTALSNDYYTVVSERLGEAFADIYSYEAKKQTYVAQDKLPSGDQLKNGAKHLVYQAVKHCKTQIKEDFSNADRKSVV